MYILVFRYFVTSFFYSAGFVLNHVEMSALKKNFLIFYYLGLFNYCNVIQNVTTIIHDL